MTCLYVWIIQKCTYAQFFFLFLKEGGEGFSIPDNTQKGAEISDVFYAI